MIQVCDLNFANSSITDTLGNYSFVSSGTVTITDHDYPANTDPILYVTDSSYNCIEFGQTATYSNGAIIQAGIPDYGSENWAVEFRARVTGAIPVNTGSYVLFFGCSAPYDDNGTIRTGGYWAISIDSFPDAMNELRFFYDYNNEDFTLKDNLDLTSWHLYKVTKTAEDILTLHIDGVLVATIDIEQQTGFKSRATLGSFALLGDVDEFPTTNRIQTNQVVRLADVKVYADPMGHAEKAISLDNLSRVFRNYNTWLSAQLGNVVGDGTLTIKVNGTTAGTFTANQSTAATANITVPTAVSELANDSGYLTSSSNLDASKLTSGTVDIERLPQGALERLVKVANEAARYALTTADVQLGDTVQQLDTGIMYVVTDTDHLDSAAGYTEYTAGTAASVPWSGVTGKPTFAAVATSGAYSDLTGTPTIPTVNDATLTIQQNGATVGTFSANQETNETINIEVPTKTSDLNNDSGFITGVSWNDVTNKPSFATVATSGSYNDLSNKPTIPTVNDATLTIQQNSVTVDTFTANSSTDKTVNITVPTNTNELTNGAGYITADYAIPRSGGAVMTGNTIARTVDTDYFAIRGGSGYGQGAQLTLYGKGTSGYEGYVYLIASDGVNDSQFALRPNSHATISCVSFRPLSGNPTLGDANYLWGQIYSTNSTISTSDVRLKNSVKDIDDKLLDAWGNIEPKQYKFNDATEKKGDKARYHTGYLAQDIQVECEKQGINASDYGLFCYDEWEEQEEEIEEIETEKDGKIVKEKHIIQPRREKGNAYALRYEEALVVECKYLRRCVERLTARIEELEKEQEARK